MKTALALGSAFALAVTSIATAQGPLTPPAGTPAPTMKTLDEIEPRTPINDTTTPGDASAEYIISASGSYYLQDNVLVGEGNTGIKVQIAGGGVTIDLNGYAITNVPENIALYAIDGGPNVSVRNGSVDGNDHIDYGIKAGRVRDVRVTDCNVSGIEAELVESVVVEGIGGIGIQAENIKNCRVVGTDGDGISGNIVEGCTVIDSIGYGIVGDNVVNCYVQGAGVPGGSVAGIQGQNVDGCKVLSDTKSGINASIVRGCFASANGPIDAKGIDAIVVIDSYSFAAGDNGQGIVASRVLGSTGYGSHIGVSARQVVNSIGINLNSTIGSFGILAKIARGSYGESKSGTGIRSDAAYECHGVGSTETEPPPAKPAIEAKLMVNCVAAGTFPYETVGSPVNFLDITGIPDDL